MLKRKVNTVACVAALNEMLGNPNGNVYFGDPKAWLGYVTTQLTFVTSENNELLKALEEDDRPQVLDGIGDVITVLDGLPFKGGFYVPEEVLDDLYENPLKFVNPILKTVNEFLFHPTIVKCEDVEAMISVLSKYWASARATVIINADLVDYDADKAFKEVHSSNMTKGCKDLEVLARTLEKYEKLGYTCLMANPDETTVFTNVKFKPESDLMFQQVGDLFVVKTHRDVKFGDEIVPPGKFLKSADYREADFTDHESFKIKRIFLG